MSTLMLYKHPGEHKLHGIMCDYIVVNEDEKTNYLVEGWAESPILAKELNEPKDVEKKESKDKKNKKDIENILGD